MGAPRDFARVLQPVTPPNRRFRDRHYMSQGICDVVTISESNGRPRGGRQSSHKHIRPIELFEYRGTRVGRNRRTSVVRRIGRRGVFLLSMEFFV